MAVKRPTYSSKSKTVRLTGFATVTVGGGGAPPCCCRSPQLATTVAIASANASFAPRRIKKNDETNRPELMNSCGRTAMIAGSPHTVASDLCPPRQFGNSLRIVLFIDVICREKRQAIHRRTRSRRHRRKPPRQ